ncbi:putative E3 ubiquitin-protein ligase SIS3 [Helianthus annuus]|nr:putative E3 ubiquitin-protein ligase SIS3 [Helianthus annuus]
MYFYNFFSINGPLMQWLTRRKVHLERAQLGITVSRISEYRVLVDMIRLPDRVFESAAQEMRVMEHDAIPHHPGLYLSENQVLRAISGEA